jgi:pimeloyl-ACP methyl ester carboxylesterase
MRTVTSKDGTAIAYERIGSGIAVILVDGALCHRSNGPNGELAKLLAQRFTVYTYDRRGRGESGDTGTYDVKREIEDIEALIEEAGEPACLYGISSGAALALEAAAGGLSLRKLALFEAPFIVDGSRRPLPDDYLPRMQRMLAEGRRGDAVKLFMRTGVGVPAPFVAMMQLMPAWPKLKAVAHTLPYDTLVMGDNQAGRPFPAERWASVTVPTLVTVGGKSPAWMQNAMAMLADVLPHAEHRSLKGQTHIVKPEALAPVLTEFFSAP